MIKLSSKYLFFLNSEKYKSLKYINITVKKVKIIGKVPIGPVSVSN